MPLAFVDHEHADGHLLGLAIALPKDFLDEQVENLYDLLGRHNGNNSFDVEEGLPYLSLSVRDPISNRQIGMLDLVLDSKPMNGHQSGTCGRRA